MNRKRLWWRLGTVILLILTLLFWYKQASDPNVQFQRLQQAFDAAYRATYSIPFDSLQLGVIEPQKLRKRIQIMDYYYPKFVAFADQKLQASYQKKWEQTRQLIKIQLIDLPKLQKDPTLYNFGSHLQKKLQSEDTPLNKRLEQINWQLQHASQYYTLAINNLVKPDSTKFQTAIQQQLQTLRFFRSELKDSLERATLPASQQQMIRQHTYGATIAVKDYLAFCRSIWFEYQNSKSRSIQENK